MNLTTKRTRTIHCTRNEASAIVEALRLALAQRPKVATRQLVEPEDVALQGERRVWERALTVFKGAAK
jgi:hypothetical protein